MTPNETMSDEIIQFKELLGIKCRIFPNKGENRECYDTRMLYEINDYLENASNTTFDNVYNIMLKRTQRLETEIKNLKSIIAKELNENDEFGKEYVITTILQDENAKLRETLKWYADDDNWVKSRPLHYERINIDDVEVRNASLLSYIGGKRARNVLKELEGEN